MAEIKIEGYIVFKNREEPIIRARTIDDCNGLFELVTPLDTYVYDTRELDENGKGELVKQRMMLCSSRGGTFQTIKSLALGHSWCEFERIVLT